MIPVHRVDSASLELLWPRDVFVDATIPFGLRSATKISAVAVAWLWVRDALQWSLGGNSLYS